MIKLGWSSYLVMAVVVAALPYPSTAAALTVNLEKSTLVVESGEVVVAHGSITNQTGIDLRSSELFFDFFGFDAVVLIPSQRLGVSADFVIPAAATSDVVELFDIAVERTAAAGDRLPILLQLQDAHGNLSDAQELTVSVAGSTTPVPEPPAASLLAAGLGLFCYLERRAWKPTCRAGLFAALVSTVQAQAPSFSTGAPVAGLVNGKAIVYLPLTNTGSRAADSVRITGAALGIQIATRPALPFTVGRLAASAVQALDLQFDSRFLTPGSNYLLVVRGTYQSGGTIFGFAVNRILKIEPASPEFRDRLERWAAIDAVSAYYDSLGSLEPRAAMRQLLAYMQARPEFVESGLSDGGYSVWGRFANGSLHTVSANRGLPKAAPASATGQTNSGEPALPVLRAALAGARDPTEVPASPDAWMATSLGRGWRAPEALTKLRSWMEDGGYVLRPGDSEQDLANLFRLKDVGGEGVFYITGHGGFTGNPRVFYVWTSTKADAAIEALFSSLGLDASDLQKARPAIVTVENLHRTEVRNILGKPTEVPIRETHYGITSRFVAKYWKRFAPSSLVYIDTCESDTPGDFIQAIFGKGATVYAGWNNLVDDGFAAADALLVFDRLLGSNQFLPERAYKQRAFDYRQVVDVDLPAHGVAKDPRTGGELVFSSNPANTAPEFGLLAPSIGWVSVINRTGLQLIGTFGQDPGLSHRSVTVGGVPLTCSWDPIIILCSDLPESGSGSEGEVVVTTRGHKSNVAMLSRWTVRFDVQLKADDSLTQNARYEFTFRGDARRVRPNNVHQDPIYPPGGPLIPSNASVEYHCSGQARSELPGLLEKTYTWTGDGRLQGLRPGDPRWFQILGGFSGGLSLKATLAINNVVKGCTQHVHNRQRVEGGTREWDEEPEELFVLSLDQFDLTFDINGTLAGGERHKNIGSATPGGVAHYSVKWSAVAASSPPDPDSAR